MDCLVFLDEVNVRDHANKDWAYKDLLVYETENPILKYGIEEP